MASRQKLKVFRAPIGFHDVYVAAPSRKAALAAWGSDHDLFARGIAEQVDDPELTREPLERPGEIIRRLRGTAAEQIAALPKIQRKPPPKTAAPARPAKASKPSRTQARPPKPRPSRTALDEAEKALAEAEHRHGEEREGLARREAELQRERRELQKSQDRELARLTRDMEKIRETYRRAMRDWEG